MFTVKIFKIGGDYFFFNGWLDMIIALKIPSKSWLLFQYEEVLDCFRMFYFYQDHVNRFFVNHKMMNIVPTYPVVIRSAPTRKWFVRMEEKECELYITTGWNRIKQEMSITDKHLVVFEMVDLQTI
ncbi:putative DNA-binding pseudobarrel domain superfamily [Helianthus anomalus]